MVFEIVRVSFKVRVSVAVFRENYANVRMNRYGEESSPCDLFLIVAVVCSITLEKEELVLSLHIVLPPRNGNS